jgi:hypothetical protein
VTHMPRPFVQGHTKSLTQKPLVRLDVV